MSSVPDTTTFSMADVVAAVLPSSNDLVECFADADDGAFDSSYGPGDESNLLQFRNYGNNTAAQNEVYITIQAGNPGTACSANRTVLAWKNRNPNSVSNNDKFWEDDNGSPGDPFPGSGGNFQYFGAFAGLNSAAFKLSTLGIASDVTSCNTTNTLTAVYFDVTGGTSTPVDYYYDSTIGDASNLDIGDILYSDIDRQNPLQRHTGIEPSVFIQNGSAATTTFCINGGIAAIKIAASTGVIITNIKCQFP